jgi:hypothetical protein
MYVVSRETLRVRGAGTSPALSRLVSGVRYGLRISTEDKPGGTQSGTSEGPSGIKISLRPACYSSSPAPSAFYALGALCVAPPSDDWAIEVTYQKMKRGGVLLGGRFVSAECSPEPNAAYASTA